MKSNFDDVKYAQQILARGKDCKTRGRTASFSGAFVHIVFTNIPTDLSSVREPLTMDGSGHLWLFFCDDICTVFFVKRKWVKISQYSLSQWISKVQSFNKYTIICVYSSVYIHMSYMCIRFYNIHIYVYTYRHTCVCTYVYVHMYTYLHTHVCKYVFVIIYMQLHRYILSYTFI